MNAIKFAVIGNCHYSKKGNYSTRACLGAKKQLQRILTKDTNPVEFIRNSLVVYADKKRTTKLLKSIGFKMPIELQQSGYIGSISYFKRSVNIFGESFSKVFKEIDEKSNKASVENQFYENFSLKGGIKINSQTPEMLDTIEKLQNGDKSAADRLAKYVDNGMISTEA